MHEAIKSEAQGVTTSIDVAQLIPRITAEIQESMRLKALESFNYTIQSAVQEEIRRYVRDHIVPVVTKELEQASTELRAAVVAGVQGAVKCVADKFVESTKTKMSGYDGTEMVRTTMKALLGITE